MKDDFNLTDNVPLVELCHSFSYLKESSSIPKKSIIGAYKTYTCSKIINKLLALLILFL